jgi:hypothetical protein
LSSFVDKLDTSMSSIAHLPLGEDVAAPSVEERRALIERVAASGQFGRSARLRDFLLYVGGQSLKEGCPEIHEQEIGAKVFGRSPSYDRSQDNIVRVNATELRKRIELYFATEGAHESLILEIPRGGYKPVFRRRRIETAIETAQPQVVHTPTAQYPMLTDDRKRTKHLGVWLLAALCLMLAVASGFFYEQNQSMRKMLYPWEGHPALASFWGDFLSSHQPTDVILPDDSLSVIEDVMRRPVSLGDYLSRNFLREIQSSNLSEERKSDLDQIFAHNLVTFGGVRAAQLMQQQISPGSPTHLVLSRFYMADAMKRDNVILIGGRKANPWVHLFDGQINFVTDFDNSGSQAFVANLNPRAGEKALYSVSYDPNTFVGYSAIAFLPNPSRTGNAIVLAGTDSDATNAAAEFLTSETDMEGFRSTLHATEFPYFEILLKISRLSGTSLSSEVLAYRTYPGLR